MIKLLFIDDNYDLSLIVKNVLENIIKGYTVKIAKNGKDGYDFWKSFEPDIIITDVFMPEINGFDFVEMIRNEDNSIPILFTSGIDNANNISKGYKLGINNYIKKPFTPDEINAYIKATLEMKTTNNNNMMKYNIGDYVFNSKNGKIHNIKTTKEYHITTLESNLLHILVKNINEVVKKDVFLNSFWKNIDKTYASFTLHTHIHNIRQVLKDDHKIKIKNIRNIGYTMVYCDNE